MLFYFPKRYPDELLYSWIARYQKHTCINSPKQIQKELFGVENNAAVVDFPSNLAEFTMRLANIMPDISIGYIIDKTTLIPYFQPFSDPSRLSQARENMASDYGGSIHTSLGLSASRIHFSQHLKVCLKCMEEQLLKYNECYWQRLFQLPSVWICDIHQLALVSTEIPFHPVNKNQFIHTPDKIQYQSLCSEKLIHKNRHKLLLLAKDSMFLLDHTCPAITNELWRARYYLLLQKNGFIKGNQHVKQEALKERLIEFWGDDLLRFLRCDLMGVIEDYWLTKLTRKIRTNFHPLLHLLLYRALEGSEISLEHLFLFDSYDKETTVKNKTTEINGKLFNAKKSEWITLINENSRLGITDLRKLNPALYAWLYRQNPNWLKQYSPKLDKGGNNAEDRVNWPRRDYELCKELLRKVYSLVSDKNSRRITKTLLAKSIGMQSLVEKNKEKLPLCYLVFERYTESITKYQCRRVWLAYQALLEDNEPVFAWKLYRQAAIRNNAAHDVHQLISRLERMSAGNVSVKDALCAKTALRRQAS